MQATYSEAVNIWLGAFGTAAFIGGLLSGHWWWPSRERLDREWDDGYHAAAIDACRRVEEHGEVLRLSAGGVARWCDAGSQWDRDGANAPIGFDEPQSSFKNVPRPDERPSGSEVAGPGHEVRPAGPSPAAGRTCPECGCEEVPDADERLSHERHCPLGPRAQGRTYSELVMLAAQDTPGLLDDALTAPPVDPGWFQDALRRSEEWLEACRAELGLVAS